MTCCVLVPVAPPVWRGRGRAVAWVAGVGSGSHRLEIIPLGQQLREAEARDGAGGDDNPGRRTLDI